MCIRDRIKLCRHKPLVVILISGWRRTVFYLISKLIILSKWKVINSCNALIVRNNGCYLVTSFVAVSYTHLCQFDREVVCVVNLRSDLKPINVHFASVGSLNTVSYTHLFENAPIKVEISKTDITGKKELPGAKLSISINN